MHPKCAVNDSTAKEKSFHGEFITGILEKLTAHFCSDFCELTFESETIRFVTHYPL